ncbi:MAG TPA: nucleotidyltransferase domain-containing protein [Sedimentisphaerales bacterium]|nr:nucleotidyltransferase domain-containing protein [Sedimentisphaerales bacterium]
MIRLIEDNREALKDLCVQYQVRRLELFGSALTCENFEAEQSDLDFLVEFLPLREGEYAETYFGLLQAIENLFNRHVDLVMTGAIKNRYFLESISKNRKVLYAA